MSAILDNLLINMELTIDDARKMLENLFQLYQKKYDTGAQQQSTSTSRTTSAGPKGSSWSFLKRKEKVASSSSAHGSSELTKYFESDFVIDEVEQFDILQWWKSKQDRFPTLSMIARDILTTPVSTVASEQAFSASNRILDERRSRLYPDILEGLMCVKDWEDARRRK